MIPIHRNGAMFSTRQRMRTALSIERAMPRYSTVCSKSVLIMAILCDEIGNMCSNMGNARVIAGTSKKTLLQIMCSYRLRNGCAMASRHPIAKESATVGKYLPTTSWP